MPAPLLIWNDKTRAELLRLKGLGHSSREIARAMGSTKGAVLGELWRMRQTAARKKDLPPPVKTKPAGRIRVARHDATKGHPMVRRLFRMMNDQQCTSRAMEARSGVSRSTVNNWKYHEPKIGDLEAALNVLGYTLAIQLMTEDEVNTFDALRFTAALKRMDAWSIARAARGEISETPEEEVS